MEAIKAMVRNGRIETTTPLDLPDGTEVLIVRGNHATNTVDDWDDTPEGIAAWLKWYDSLEPLIFTDAERAAWEEDKKARKAWEFEHADEYDQKLRGMWK